MTGQQIASDSRPQPAITNRVLRAVASNYLGKAIRLGLWFGLTPFLITHLGVTQYALWILVGSVVAFGALLDFGIAGAMIRYVSAFVARDENDDARRLISTVLWVYIFIGLVAFAASVAIAPFFPHWFAVPEEDSSMASAAVILMGLSLAVDIPAATAPAVLQGLQRHGAFNIISVGGAVLSAVTIVGVVLAGGGLLGMLAANIPVTIIVTLVTMRYIGHVAPGLKFGLGEARFSTLRPVFSYSWSIFVIQIAGQLQRKTDQIVIGRFLPVALVAPYSIGQKLSDLGLMLTDQFLRVLLPLAAQLDAQGDRERLKVLFLTATRVALVLSIPIALLVTVLAEPFIRWWIGPSFDEAVPIVAVLSLAGVATIIHWPAGLVLQGMARHRLLAASSVASGIANLALSVVLVQHVGIVGVALGTLVPTVLEAFGFVLPYSARVVGVRWQRLAREAILPAVLPALPMALVLVGLERWSRPTDPLSLAPVAMAGGLTYAIIYIRFGAGPIERGLLQSLLALARRRVGRPPPS